jgi:hypothetical protein
MGTTSVRQKRAHLVIKIKGSYNSLNEFLSHFLIGESDFVVVHTQTDKNNFLRANLLVEAIVVIYE